MTDNGQTMDRGEQPGPTATAQAGQQAPQDQPGWWAEDEAPQESLPPQRAAQGRKPLFGR